MDTVRFHDSLPTSEMIAWVSARKGQMSNSLCFQIQKELAQDGAVRTPKAFFPTLALLSIFVLLLQNNACQLTSFSCQGFTSPVLQFALQPLVEIVCALVWLASLTAGDFQLVIVREAFS